MKVFDPQTVRMLLCSRILPLLVLYALNLVPLNVTQCR
jgi:hypothetical protein